jgi:hypothetical protein
MARPILDALKSGNIQELYKVDDVLPADIETLLRVITNTSKQSAPLTKSSQEENTPDSKEQKAIGDLKRASPSQSP